jgi:hypothetical protein
LIKYYSRYRWSNSGHRPGARPLGHNLPRFRLDSARGGPASSPFATSCYFLAGALPPPKLVSYAKGDTPGPAESSGASATTPRSSRGHARRKISVQRHVIITTMAVPAKAAANVRATEVPPGPRRARFGRPPPRRRGARRLGRRESVPVRVRGRRKWRHGVAPGYFGNTRMTLMGEMAEGEEVIFIGLLSQGTVSLDVPLWCGVLRSF